MGFGRVVSIDGVGIVRSGIENKVYYFVRFVAKSGDEWGVFMEESGVRLKYDSFVSQFVEDCGDQIVEFVESMEVSCFSYEFWMCCCVDGFWVCCLIFCLVVFWL